MGQQPWDAEPGEPSPYQPPPTYQPYGYAGPPAPYQFAAPYGVDPATGMPYSDKSKVAAGLLQILLSFVSICGVGRLYTGHIAIGLAQLLGMLIGWVLVCVFIGFVIVPAIWLWTVIDGIVLLTGRSTDAQGRLLR